MSRVEYVADHLLKEMLLASTPPQTSLIYGEFSLEGRPTFSRGVAEYQKAG